jgi:hypothetical protein
MRCQNFDPNRGRGEQYYNATFNTNNKWKQQKSQP